jgi:hypothetical protein
MGRSGNGADGTIPKRRDKMTQLSTLRDGRILPQISAPADRHRQSREK